jgi:hypothetical protein
MVLVKKKMCALLKVTKLGFGGQIIKGVKLENNKSALLRFPYVSSFDSIAADKRFLGATEARARR